MSTRAQLLAEIAAQFPDNTTRAITPAKLRQVCEDIANSSAVPAAGDGSLLAADITDASATGRSLLKAATQAAALGILGPLPQYTAADLAALTDGNRPPVAYCTDCLVPEGVGAAVFWTGSAWVCTCSMFPVVTTWIDYFRAEYARGGSVSNRAGVSAIEPIPFAASLVQAVTNSGSSSDQLLNASIFNWRRMSGSTSNAGVRIAAPAVMPNRALATYLAASNYSRALSTVADAFNFRIGFTSAVSYALAEAEFGICYDPQNALGGLNAGGSVNYIGFVRKGNVNLSSGVSGVAMGTAIATPARLECLIVTGVGVYLYVNGTLIHSDTTNLPDTGVGLTPHLVFNRSAFSAIGRDTDFAAPYRSVRYSTPLT